MYLTHFGLNRPPFRSTPDPELFYPGGRREATVEALVYAVTDGEGMVKLIGEAGCGKTLLYHLLKARLAETTRLVYLGDPTLAPGAVLYAIALALQLPVTSQTERLEVLQCLQSHLLDGDADGRRVVVFADAAHELPLEALEEIRLLSNLETRQGGLLQVVLASEPLLDRHLADPRARQIRDRIAHSFRLGPLTAAETGDYLRFRLQAAGCSLPQLFPPAAGRRIARASGGLIRRINVIADKALLAAFSERAYAVTPRHVRAAVRDSEFHRPLPVAWVGAAAGTLGAAAMGGWLLWSGLLVTAPAPPPPEAAARDEVVEATPARAAVRAEPVGTAPASAVASAEPVEAAPTPAVARAEPIEEPAPAPAVASTEPVEAAPTPAVASAAPVQAAPTPAVVSTAPVEAAPATAVVSTAPVQAAPTPAVVSTAPVEAAPTPAVAGAAPVEAAPTPVVASTAPVEAAPAPAVVSTEPVEAVPAPAVSTEPVEAVPAPAVVSTAPVEAAPTPAVARAAPVEAAPAPAVVSTAPADAEPVEVVADAPAVPAAAPDAEAPPNHPLLEQRIASTLEWLEQANGRHYTIQLLTANGALGPLEALLAEARNAGLLGHVYAYHTVRAGLETQVIVYGEYPGVTPATAAIADLPETLRAYQPFVRNVSAVQTESRAAGRPRQ